MQREERERQRSQIKSRQDLIESEEKQRKLIKLRQQQQYKQMLDEQYGEKQKIESIKMGHFNIINSNNNTSIDADVEYSTIEHNRSDGRGSGSYEREVGTGYNRQSENSNYQDRNAHYQY